MHRFGSAEHKKGLNEEDIKFEGNVPDIKVIGAGLPRTGTLSLRTALTILYPGKCYHMLDVLAGKQEDVTLWMRALNGEISSDQFREYFSRKGYICGVDFPFCRFWKDLMKAYPDAKIVLSTRDPDSWYDSVFNSIHQVVRVIRENWSVRMLLAVVDGRRPAPHDLMQGLEASLPDGCAYSMEDAIAKGPEASKKFFMDWEAEVKRVVPSNRLLVHSAKEGWEPLCAFLGVPIPTEDYPRVNDTKAIQKLVRNMKIMAGIMVYALPSVIVVVMGVMLKA